MNLRIVRRIDIYVGIPLAYLVFCLKKIFRRINEPDIGKDYKKILFVKFWGVGNVIMLLPVVQALKERYPLAKIDFLTLLTNRDVAKSAAIFNNIYTIDDKNLLKFLSTAAQSFAKLKGRKYDLIIDCEQFARFSAIFSALISGKRTIGFNTRGQHRNQLYTDPITYDNNIHITKSFYSLAERVQVVHKDDIKPTPLICNQDDIDQINKRLKSWRILDKDILGILHIGTSKNFSLRRWPVECFADLADRLIDHFGVKIVFTGLAYEAQLAEQAMGYMKNKNAAVNASNRLNFYQFVALIKLSDLLISADTAPVHLATCLSVPVVGLYGPNTPLLYGAWGEKSICFYKNLSCSPCITNYNAKINKCRHPEGPGACMKKITVDEVFSTIKNTYFDKDNHFKFKKIDRNE